MVIFTVIDLIRMGNLCIKDILKGILRCDSCMEINSHLNLRRLSSNSSFEGVHRIKFMFTLMVLKYLWEFYKKIDENLYHIYDPFLNPTVSLK